MIHKKFRFLFMGFASIVLLLACEDDPPTSEFTPPDSSYGLIYSKIFETSCGVSGCHNGGANTPSPSLIGAGTYAAIFSQTPSNQEAVQAGLLLVQPGVADSSFLYQKLVFSSSPFKFGSPMPQGGLTLDSSSIEFVRLWIEAGAPEQGHVADRSLIE